MNIGIIILAAGASTRLGGQAKQLIQWEGRSLLRRMVDEALATDLRPVVVVLGARKAEVAPELDHLPITIIDNPFWEQGLSTSVKTGLAALYLTQKELDGVLFLLTDQPHVGSGVIRQLVHVFQESGKGMVACRYQGRLGVPALISRDYFTELLALEGDQGARRVIAAHAEDCAVVEFEAGGTDLDTPEDLERFLEED